MRGATGLPARVFRIAAHISIHAPHARSDAGGGASAQKTQHFNPRSSCEERRQRRGGRGREDTDFNPRSSCEERQPSRRTQRKTLCDFNPRSSCEERLESIDKDGHAFGISIHAPHARSDLRSQVRPAGDAGISIHAPHARSDE